MAYVKKDYVQSDAVNKAQQALQNQQASKPGQYQSQWQGQMDSLLGQIQNRPDFKFDINADALWNQYKDQYVHQGRQAMMDTMGQAQTMTGGYGNSYAQTVGQQTYQGYLQGLNDKIPDLYGMAMQKYQMEGDDLLNQYGMIADRESQDYGRYQDAVNQYYAELDRLQGIYDSERNFDYGTWADSEDFAYGQYRDDVADQQWQDSFDYQKQQNDLAYQQWLQEFEYQKAQDDRAYNQWLQEFQYQQARDAQAAASRSSGGGSSRGSTPAQETVSEEDQAAMDYVDRMLDNISSSRADPSRVIASNSNLTSSQKETAQKYLSGLLEAGYMR